LGEEGRELEEGKEVGGKGGWVGGWRRKGRLEVGGKEEKRSEGKIEESRREGPWLEVQRIGGRS
jgi:hypothetical protein